MVTKKKTINKNIKKLSIHRPTKKNYTIRHKHLGHYLAGLIDADGHFSTIGHVVIAYNIREIRDVYKLRSILKFGFVRKVKDKQAVNLIISNKQGVIKIAKLVKDKIKHPNKIKQYNTRLVKLFKIEKTSLSSEIEWDTPWFSGFFDGDGHLRIHILRRKNRPRPEVRLLGQIDQKTDVLLKQFKDKFGGYMGYRKSQNTFYYSTTSFANMNKLLSFFDEFSLQFNSTFLRYTVLRKAYLLVQEKTHLTESGLKKIKKYHRKLINII